MCNLLRNFEEKKSKGVINFDHFGCKVKSNTRHPERFSIHINGIKSRAFQFKAPSVGLSKVWQAYI